MREPESLYDFCHVCDPGGRGPACWQCEHDAGYCDDDCPICAEIDATRCSRCNEPDWPYPGICDSCHDELIELDRTIHARIYAGWSALPAVPFVGPWADLLTTLDLKLTWTLGWNMVIERERNEQGDHVAAWHGRTP
jgi:hypothetical protein